MNSLRNADVKQTDSQHVALPLISLVVSRDYVNLCKPHFLICKIGMKTMTSESSVYHRVGVMKM